MGECNRHGSHRGTECPVCTQEAATLRAAAMSADAITAQTERLAAEAQLAAERQAAAQHEVQRAIEEGILANRELARDGWKLEVQSKVERSLELFKAKLVDEASSLLSAALTQDPGNLHGHLLRSMIAEQSGDTASHEEHTIKAIRLLGVSGSEAARAYRSVVLAVHASAPDHIRQLLTEKLVEFARGASLDNSLLILIARKRWDDILLALTPHLAPTLITRDVLQAIISHGCVKSGLVLARNVLSASTDLQHSVMWIVGSMVLIELAVKHGVGDGETSVPRPTDWPIADFAAIFETYADNAAWYNGGFAEGTVSRFHTLLRDIYVPARQSIFERLVSMATTYARSAQGSVVAIGCGLAFVTYLVVGIFLGMVIAAMGANQGIGLFIGVLVSPIGGVLGALQYSKYARNKRYGERYGYLYHRQLAVEQSFGLALTPATVAAA